MGSVIRSGRLSAVVVAMLVLTLVPATFSRAASPLAALKSTGHTVLGCSTGAGGVHRSAPGSGRTVALTFDDGPGKSTAQIMAVLAKYRVTATFFNLGDNEARNHAVVRREQTAGYLLGDHTWDHQSLPTLTAAQQGREIDRERTVQASITGARPCLLRPPYGNFNTTTLAQAAARGMQVWNWSVDTEDWKASGSGARYWVQRITSRAEAGVTQKHPVILMHNQPNGNPATVSALPAIIRFYQARHYRFVDLHANTGLPTVRRVEPDRGSVRAGTRVIVTGQGFRSVRKVVFGSVAAYKVQVVSPTEIIVRAPAHSAGVTNVRVLTDHGTSPPTRSDRFTFVAPPTVRTISPHSGATSGGAVVHLRGTNLSGHIIVKFGTATASHVHVLSSTQLVATAPAHPAGSVTVRVSTPYGTSAVREATHFGFVAAPRITSVAPIALDSAGGQLVTVLGTALTPTVSVTVDGSAAIVVASSPTRLVITSPAHVPGTVDIRARTPYGTSVRGPTSRVTYVDSDAGG